MYPPPFIAWLGSLGVDPAKDGEVYHCGATAPGHHVYGGWFHFVGALDTTGDFPLVKFSDHFEAGLSTAQGPPLTALKSHSLVQIDFHASAVPWLLDEPEET